MPVSGARGLWGGTHCILSSPRGCSGGPHTWVRWEVPGGNAPGIVTCQRWVGTVGYTPQLPHPLSKWIILRCMFYTGSQIPPTGPKSLLLQVGICL